MIGYKDMTFCPFWKDCKSAHMCGRPLTEEVKKAADKFGLPISMFAARPSCWSLKEPEEEVVKCH